MSQTDFSKINFGKSGWKFEGWFHVYELDANGLIIPKFHLPRFSDGIGKKTHKQRLVTLAEYVGKIDCVVFFENVIREHEDCGCWDWFIQIGENIRAQHHPLMALISAGSKISPVPIWAEEPCPYDFPGGLTQLGAEKVLIRAVSTIAISTVYFVSKFDQKSLEV